MSYIVIQTMSHNWLKPSALFLICCRVQGQLHYLSNPSSITNTLILDRELRYSHISNFLFEITVPEEYQRSVPCKFYEPLTVKHRFSQKYLNFAEEMGEQNYEGCKLSLSHQKIRWTMLPCFKYQTKNTQNIEFAERIFITQQFYQDPSSKSLFVKQHRNKATEECSYNLLFGYHTRSQILLIKFHERNGANFHYGQCLKIYHQESYAFLVDSTPPGKLFGCEEGEKLAVAFENEKEKLGESQLDGIWIIEEAAVITGRTAVSGTVLMNSEIRLKNCITQQYLTLQDHSTDDEIFKMVGDREESVYSVFKLEAVKEEDRVVTAEVQVRMRHSIVYQYMAVSRYRESHALIEIKMDKIPQDEHFYEFKPISFNAELIIYFLISIKKELENVNAILSKDPSRLSLDFIKKVYTNIEIDLKVMEKLPVSGNLLKEELNHFIPLMFSNITLLWQASKVIGLASKALQIIGLNNKILLRISSNDIRNQIKIFKYIHILMPCLFKQLNVEQLFLQIFTNNIKLLSQISDYNQMLKCSIIEAIFTNIQIQCQKDKFYWRKMTKIINLMQVLVKNYDKYIDINQRMIALQLFNQNMLFDRLFFQIKIKKSLFYIHHPTSNIEMPVNNFKELQIREIITEVLTLIAFLTEDRNIISKKLISQYLHADTEKKKEGQDHWNRSQDLKAIINCFYIRNQGGLRSKIFLLLSSLFVDSFPRLKRFRPINVIKLDIESMRISDTKDVVSEIAELSSRLKESIMLKAERSYFSRPLSFFKSQTDNSFASARSNDEPSFTNSEIGEFKKIVLLLLETQVWTIQILKILRMMLNLSILLPEQKLSFYNKIFVNICTYSTDSLIIKQLLMILEDLLKALKQDILQKTKMYLILMHYKEKEKLDESDIQYFIQSARSITFDKIKETATNQLISTRYNEIAAYIHQYYRSHEEIDRLISIFLKNEYEPETMLNFMQIIANISTPCAQISSLLLSTSILGQQDLSQFGQLEAYSLEINNLSEISEEWLCNQEEDSPNYLRFIYLMNQITNFMFQDYTLDLEEGTKYRKKQKINKFRQIIMKNIGMHEYILNLLNINDYLLEGQTLKTLNKKIRISMQKCFDFLFEFCNRCEQNKDILFLEMGIINKYINLLQVGQTQLWIHLIKNKKKLIQEITIEDVEKIIFKIVKDRTSPSTSNCDYNPLYIDQLMTLVDINGKPFKPNIEKIAKVLEQPLILKKFLYLIEQKKKRNQFCLQLYKLRIDPTQVPVIYQAKLIELLIYMIKQLGNKNSFLRKAFKNLISLDYLFYLATVEDAFVQEGIPTDMNFVLKIEVLKMLSIYLNSKEIESAVYECIEITKFLEYYQTVFTSRQVRKQSMVDNEMLYYSYIEKYEEIINYFLQNSEIFYSTYLYNIFSRLEEIFEKLPNKQKDENYQLLVILLDKKALKQLKLEPSPKSIQKQIEIYMKWSSFIPMSSSSTRQQSKAKNLLFQILTNDKTQSYLDNQKSVLFSNLQRHEEQFLLRIKSILTNITLNFKDFHQKPLYKLILLFNQYVSYKLNKPIDPFSSKAPQPVLSQTFQILLIPMIRLMCSQNFDYNRVFCQKIFYHSLLVINAILSFKIKMDCHESILEFLKDEVENGIEFLKCLRKAIVQLVDEESIETINQEINYAQSSMQLISEQQKIEPLLPSLIFIKQLCRFLPFTDFLRGHYFDEFDYLNLIYTNLMTILSQGAQKLNIQKVKRIEYLCQALSFFFNGCNKINQQIVANKEFIIQAESFLKIDLLQQKQDKSEHEETLINEISSIYAQSIPDYLNLLKKELQFFRFKHFYVTNSVKVSLIKVMLAATISNELTIEKFKLHLSVELIKLNIIVLHEQALRYTDKAKEVLYLQKFQNWRQVFEHQSDFLMSFTLSTYGFSLIKALEGELESSEKVDPNKKVSSELGEIQRFLPQQLKLLLKQLKQEPFFRDILLFYRKYFQAYLYFKDTFVSVEIVANEEKKIIDVTFPRLPMCDHFGADMLQDLQYESNRINQQQTNKSFIILASKYYEQINGDISFNLHLTNKYPHSSYLIKIFKASETFYSIFCIVNLLISLLYLLANFELYSQNSTFEGFQDEIFLFYDPKTALRGFLIILQLINLTLCTLLVLFLVLKKAPFYFFLHLKAYHQLSVKQRVGIYKYQLGYGIFNLLISVFLDIFLVVFSGLTIIHPVFSTFMLLYLVTRLQLGKILIKMVRSLYIELLILIGVLVVFNYLYAIFIYVNLTVGTSYGAQCVDMFVCIKLFMDQIIKGGFVTLLPNDYIDNTVTLQFFTEYSYNLLVPGVLIEIFRGLNIDKMSYFREKVEAIEKNQKEKCYICGQKQFEIDLVLEGYERHQNITHNRLHYIAFIFYLKRKNREKYLFYQDLVSTSLLETKYSWIPFETSIRKQQMMAGEVVELPFKTKLLSSLEEKESQARRILANARKMRREITKYMQITQDDLSIHSPPSPSSPMGQKVNDSRQHRSR